MRYLIIAIVGLIILIFFSSTMLKNQFEFKRFSLPRLLSYHREVAKTEKLIITLKMVKEHPLLGVGLNHYRLRFDEYSSDDYKRIEEEIRRKGVDPYEWKVPDNMYFSILAETGIVGLLTFLSFLFLLFKRSLSQLKAISDDTKKGFLIACFCGTIGLLITFHDYDLLYWINPLFLFWFLIGALRSIE